MREKKRNKILFKIIEVHLHDVYSPRGTRCPAVQTLVSRIHRAKDHVEIEREGDSPDTHLYILRGAPPMPFQSKPGGRGLSVNRKPSIHHTYI